VLKSLLTKPNFTKRLTGDYQAGTKLAACCGRRAASSKIFADCGSPLHFLTLIDTILPAMLYWLLSLGVVD